MCSRQALARMRKAHPDVDEKAVFTELASDWLFRVPAVRVAASHAALRSGPAGSSQPQPSSSADHPPAASTTSPHAVLRPVGTSSFAQTHCFEFAAVHPDHPGAPVPHSADVPYLFGNLDVLYKGTVRLAPEASPPVCELADRMQDAWASFCRCGNPGWGCAGYETSAPVQRVWSLPDQPGRHCTPTTEDNRVWNGFNFEAVVIPEGKA